MATDVQEKDAFMKKLFLFHEQQGNPLRRIPMLGGRELDLHHLYSKVTSLGGYEEVTKCRLWGEVARSFNLPPSVTSASYAVRLHFEKLLQKFEAFENGTLFNPVTPVVPLKSAVAHTPVRQQRTTAVATPSRVPPAPNVIGKDHIYKSLLSGFPNEADLAFNLLVTISLDSKATEFFKIDVCFLDVMLAHVGVLPEDSKSLEYLALQGNGDIFKAWGQMVPEWVCGSMLPCGTLSPRKYAGVLCPQQNEEMQYRVSQLSVILKNLSPDSRFSRLISEHYGAVRFTVLCAYCCLMEVQQAGMEILAHMMPHLTLQKGDHFSPVALLLSASLKSVMSSDKQALINGLEVLSSLSCINDFSLEYISGDLYERLMQLLLLPDYDIVLSTLGALYSLSLFECQAPLILSVDGLIDTLMSMLWIGNIHEDALVPTKLKQLHIVGYSYGPTTTSQMMDLPSSENLGQETATTTEGTPETVDSEVESKPVCWWDSCFSAHYSWSSLLHHVVTVHITMEFPAACKWVGCQIGDVKRMRPSLITHIQLHHCNGSTPPPEQPSVSATLARLKSMPAKSNDEETTVTKAVRLTAALVLRNITSLSPSLKKYLKKYETALSQVAISTNESSHVVAQFLLDS